MKTTELIAKYEETVQAFLDLHYTIFGTSFTDHTTLCKIETGVGEGMAVLLVPNGTSGWSNEPNTDDWPFPEWLLDASPLERMGWADQQKNMRVLKESMAEKERKRADKEDRRRMFNELKQEFGSDN